MASLSNQEQKRPQRQEYISGRLYTCLTANFLDADSFDFAHFDKLSAGRMVSLSNQEQKRPQSQEYISGRLYTCLTAKFFRRGLRGLRCFLDTDCTPLRCASPGQAAYARLGILDKYCFLSKLSRKIRHRPPKPQKLRFLSES
jgi:hypothetical protein